MNLSISINRKSEPEPREPTMLERAAIWFANLRRQRRGEQQPNWFERSPTAMRYVIVATAAMIVGFVLAMLFDPRTGRRRRRLARDRMGRIVRRGTRSVRRAGRGTAAQTVGMTKRVIHSGGVANPIVDDRTLEQRVQSMIFRETGVPKDSISISVVEGFVELRGALESPRDAEALVNAAREIPGVRGVHNYLHPVGTTAPNKVEAQEASEIVERVAEFTQDRSLPH